AMVSWLAVGPTAVETDAALCNLLQGTSGGNVCCCNQLLPNRAFSSCCSTAVLLRCCCKQLRKVTAELLASVQWWTPSARISHESSRLATLKAPQARAECGFTVPSNGGRLKQEPLDRQPRRLGAPVDDFLTWRRHHQTSEVGHDPRDLCDP